MDSKIDSRVKSRN